MDQIWSREVHSSFVARTVCTGRMAALLYWAVMLFDASSLHFVQTFCVGMGCHALRLATEQGLFRVGLACRRARRSALRSKLCANARRRWPRIPAA
jgi:hypothetical protein